MFDIFGAVDSFMRQPSGWLAILLVVMVVFLVRVVIDQRDKIALVEQSTRHHPTFAQLKQFSNEANRRQLGRIRAAARRAAKAAATATHPSAILAQFDHELQAEVNALDGEFGPRSAADDEDCQDAAATSSATDDDGGDREDGGGDGGGDGPGGAESREDRFANADEHGGDPDDERADFSLSRN